MVEPVVTRPDKLSFQYCEKIMQSQDRPPQDTDREVGTTSNPSTQKAKAEVF